MKLIAITGKSGSGKTYFAKLLSKIFYETFDKKVLHIDVDKIGHEVTEDLERNKVLLKLFGDKILDEKGLYSRRKLSDLVFSNKDALMLLNKTTLPKMRRKISDILLNNLDKDYVILDYALLPLFTPFFNGSHYKILITSNIEERKNRILSRDNISEQKFLERENASLDYNPNDYDIVIENNQKLAPDSIPIINKYAFETCLNIINFKPKKVYYPGSFDPITYGHIDIINKALNCGFDRVIVGVTSNLSKKNSMFTLTERYNMIKELFENTSKVEVIAVEQIKASTKVAKEYGCSAMIRGLRNVTDFEYELNLSKVNSNLSDVETIFLTSSHKYDFVSSSIARELAYLNEDISSYVPPLIQKYVNEKINKINK